MLRRRKEVLFPTQFDLQQTSVVDVSWSASGWGAISISFFPLEHLLLQSTISITPFEVSEIILCIISEFIGKGL